MGMKTCLSGEVSSEETSSGHFCNRLILRTSTIESFFWWYCSSCWLVLLVLQVLQVLLLLVNTPAWMFISDFILYGRSSRARVFYELEKNMICQLLRVLYVRGCIQQAVSINIDSARAGIKYQIPPNRAPYVLSPKVSTGQSAVRFNLYTMVCTWYLVLVPFLESLNK